MIAYRHHRGTSIYDNPEMARIFATLWILVFLVLIIALVRTAILQIGMVQVKARVMDYGSIEKYGVEIYTWAFVFELDGVEHTITQVDENSPDVEECIVWVDKKGKHLLKNKQSLALYIIYFILLTLFMSIGFFILYLLRGY